MITKVKSFSSAGLGIFIVNVACVHVFAFFLLFLFMIVFILDNCKKFGLVFDNVVGIVEVINSRDIQIQVNIQLRDEDQPRTSGEEKTQHIATRDFQNSQSTTKVRSI